MRVAVYLRQSSDRTGEGLGIDRQREEVLRLTTSRGWTDVVEFVDNDTSALSRKPRPAFTEMLARVDAGEFDVIVSRHMDRLLRRLAELESVLARCTAANVFIVTASDSVDTSTDGGRLVARLLASVAQGEVERKAARQRAAAVQAAKLGVWIGGRRAFGYEPDGVTIREDEAELIRRGYFDVLAGESLGEITRRWNASGFTTTQSGGTFRRGVVKDILCNARYAGLRRHRPDGEVSAMRKNPELGVVGQAEWPGVVDEATWRAAVRVLCSPDRRRAPIGSKGLLTGIAVCGVCGRPVHRGGGVRGQRMYRCASGKHVARLADPIDSYVSDVVVEVLKRPDAAALWTPERDDMVDLMARADVLRRRLDDVDADYTDAVIGRQKYRELRERVLANLAEIESAVAAANAHSPLSIVASADVDAAWSVLSVAARRTIIGAVCVPVLHLVGRGTRTFRPESVEFRWRNGGSESTH